MFTRTMMNVHLSLDYLLVLFIGIRNYRVLSKYDYHLMGLENLNYKSRVTGFMKEFLKL